MFPSTPDLKAQVRLCVALALTVCVAGANAATASFTDVPAENRFAESVTRVQESGIATGFPDGSFRPREPINRQQAAAWIDRSASRIALDWSGSGHVVLNAGNPLAVLTEIEVTSPAAVGGAGWVILEGGAGGVAVAAGDGCPCVVQLYVRDESDALLARSVLTVIEDPTGTAVTIAPILAIVPIEGGATHTYRVEVEITDMTQTIGVKGPLYATYSSMAEGTPDAYESSGPDPVESMVP